jgi:ferredoxin
MVSFIVGSIFIFRFFCRFFCPLGALYGLFNKISIFGIKLDKPKCIDCGLCISKCKMDIHHVGDHECISCGECIDVCPTKAISFKGSKIFLKDNEISQSVITEAPINTESATVSSAKAKKPMTLERKRKIVKSIIAVALAIIMVGAIVYYNFIDKPPVMPDGYEVGNACPEGAVSIIDANGLTGSTFDPSKNTGKVTVINFWGVWCGPCLAELPEFAQASDEFKDSVTVFAIHTVEDANKAPKYIC